MYNKVVTSAAKPGWELFTSLVDLTDKATNAIIHTVLNEFSGTTMEWPNCNPICDKALQRKLLDMITKSDGTPMPEKDGQATWDAFLMKTEDYNPLFLEKMLF